VPVTITTTPGTAYVWANAAFSWDATEAGKAWQDASATSFLAEESDGLLLAPLEARLPLISDSESLGLADADAFAATASVAEVLSLSETYIDLIAFILTAAETIGIGETAPRQITQSPFAEILGLVDSVSKNPTTVTNEAWGTFEQDAAVIGQAIAESTAFTAQSTRDAVIPRSSTFTLGEFRAAEANQSSLRSLAFAETYTHLIAFIAQIPEQISIADARGNTLTKQAAERLALLDRLLRASGAVIADLAFQTTVLDDEGFAALVAEARPLGFSAFRDLTPGDYEYARALIRLALAAPSTSNSRIALTDARFIVDVPDIRDRGTVAVPIGGLTVAFSQPFNAPPEVQATFKGGATIAVPQIGTITTGGFQLTLINPATESPVAGNASWAAEGY
jgi:enamine deaminase RidA (YjgF/YER057c/UK114 family)